MMRHFRILSLLVLALHWGVTIWLYEAYFGDNFYFFLSTLGIMVVEEALLLYVQERWHRKQLSTNGKTCVCGYDLRETPCRCPECGRMVPQRSRIAPQDPYR
jgi:hypothetical protein